MTRFSASTDNEAVVPADRMDIWAVLTDPDALTDLTPMLEGIDAQGELWTWHLKRISALGVGITPSFTERMSFEEGRRIDYVHEPPAGTSERTGARGWYEMHDADGGTNLKISLTLTVDLPLPRAAAPAVQRVMTRMMRRTGDEFSANLYARLGIADKYQPVSV
jgi:carbon monoxide dehydrogenase subunit G